MKFMEFAEEVTRSTFLIPDLGHQAILEHCSDIAPISDIEGQREYLFDTPDSLDATRATAILLCWELATRDNASVVIEYQRFPLVEFIFGEARRILGNSDLHYHFAFNVNQPSDPDYAIFTSIGGVVFAVNQERPIRHNVDLVVRHYDDEVVFERTRAKALGRPERRVKRNANI
jgi:hypothetical protein